MEDAKGSMEVRGDSSRTEKIRFWTGMVSLQLVILADLQVSISLCLAQSPGSKRGWHDAVSSGNPSAALLELSAFYNHLRGFWSEYSRCRGELGIIYKRTCLLALLMVTPTSLNIHVLPSITTLSSPPITIIPIPSINQSRLITHCQPPASSAATSSHNLRLLRLRPPLLNFFRNLGGLCSILPHEFKTPYDHHITLICLVARTMMLFGAPALLLLLIVACVAAPTAPRVDSSDPEVAKRWYSVVEDHEVAHAHVRPWPLGHDGSRTIAYCFENIESYHGLNHIFELGLAKWEPAMRLSVLRVAPDPTCEQEPCLCDEPDVDDGTLRIGLVQGNQPAAGSIGYKGLDHEITPNKPRNYLRWPTDDPFFFGPLAPLLMAHELGQYLY